MADSVSSANELFNACHAHTAACPTSGGVGSDSPGAVAIVLDGAVLSAPAVDGPDLADDAFFISSAFDEASARDLAAALS